MTRLIHMYMHMNMRSHVHTPVNNRTQMVSIVAKISSARASGCPCSSVYDASSASSVHVCGMTHLHVWMWGMCECGAWLTQKSFCVSILLHVLHVLCLVCACVWHDSFAHLHVWMRGMTHLEVFLRVNTLALHVLCLICACVWHDSFICMNGWHDPFRSLSGCPRSFMYNMSSVYVCDVTYSQVRMWDMTHSGVFLKAHTLLFWHVASPCVWHNSFICVNVGRDSFRNLLKSFWMPVLINV